MIVLDGEQRTKQWFEARCGMLTASRIADIMPLSRGGYSTKRKNYALQLVFERITEVPMEHYVSPAMEYGTDNEFQARAAYELERNVDVDLVSFVFHPTIKMAGCSPDGLVGKDGLVEFKVPNPTTHIEYLINGSVPMEYLPQMAFQMACCPERSWNDFCSHDPRLQKKPELQTFIIRLERPTSLISAMEDEARKFLAEVDEMMERLQETYGTSGETVIERKLKQSLIQRGVDPELGITEQDVRA